MANQRFSIYEISDSDEPGYSVIQGMTHSTFEGVQLVLIGDDSLNDFDWYGTPRTEDDLPTRPVLLFYEGDPPTDEQARLYIESLANKQPRAEHSNEMRQLLDFEQTETLQTIPFHFQYPPYPWLLEAELGMKMGLYFNQCSLESWQDATEEIPGSFTFKFSRTDPVESTRRRGDLHDLETLGDAELDSR